MVCGTKINCKSNFMIDISSTTPPPLPDAHGLREMSTNCSGGSTYCSKILDARLPAPDWSPSGNPGSTDELYLQMVSLSCPVCWQPSSTAMLHGPQVLYCISRRSCRVVPGISVTESRVS